MVLPSPKKGLVDKQDLYGQLNNRVCIHINSFKIGALPSNLTVPVIEPPAKRH